MGVLTITALPVGLFRRTPDFWTVPIQHFQCLDQLDLLWFGTLKILQHAPSGTCTSFLRLDQLEMKAQPFDDKFGQQRVQMLGLRVPKPCQGCPLN